MPNLCIPLMKEQPECKADSIRTYRVTYIHTYIYLLFYFIYFQSCVYIVSGKMLK